MDHIINLKHRFMEKYFISYTCRQGRQDFPASFFVYGNEIASILRNMAHLAMCRGFQYSNVTLKRV